MERIDPPAMDGQGPDETTGQVIRSTRKRRGLSQARLATRLVERSGNPSLTRQHVTRWEADKIIPGRFWRRWLSVVLDLPPYQLERAATLTRTAQAVSPRPPAVTPAQVVAMSGETPQRRWWRCPAQVRLTENTIVWLERDPHRLHMVFGTYQCELRDRHGTGVHAALVQDAAAGYYEFGGSGIISLWTWWNDDFEGYHITPADTCMATDHYPSWVDGGQDEEELCLLFVGHP